jgi:DNA-binding response OmpR family regulator
VPAHILVVDDDPAMRRLLQTTLTLEGHEVTLARSADEAWKQLGRLPVDLIILDLMMPGMPPQQFVSRVRAEFTTTPILVLSGHHAGLEIGLLIGADDAMEKPFDPEELLERISKLLAYRVSI